MMNLVLTETRCRVCKIRLTEFEIENKASLCMDCFDEQSDEQEAAEDQQNTRLFK